MIIVMSPEATEEEISHVVKKIRDLGMAAHVSKGEERTVIGAIGDEAIIREHPLDAFPGVESVMAIMKPYKLVSREFQKHDTVIDVRGVKIGGNQVVAMAGPCSVETREGLIEVAKAVKDAGALVLRGGAFKPRTSPYAFQGLGVEGLKYLAEAREATGLPIVTELMDPRDMDAICEYADIIQIGARNMQNFRLLQEVGRTNKPVVLKRGLSATILELLMSAEYIASQGNRNIILCERGIRTFETATRNTMDISAVPVLKQLTHLPVMVDPSHGVGKWDLVAPMAKAAIAAGADGLIIEVHQDPENALCDGPQSLKPVKFDALMKELRRVAEAVGRSM
jgi:3-deoxy-7-phosphoheptulonate synthase